MLAPLTNYRVIVLNWVDYALEGANLPYTVFTLPYGL